MFLLYFIISGLIVGIWGNYREYTTTSGVTLLDVILNFIGGFIIGWLMLPIILIALLDNIKIK